MDRLSLRITYLNITSRERLWRDKNVNLTILFFSILIPFIVHAYFYHKFCYLSRTLLCIFSSLTGDHSPKLGKISKILYTFKSIFTNFLLDYLISSP